MSTRKTLAERLCGMADVPQIPDEISWRIASGREDRLNEHEEAAADAALRAACEVLRSRRPPETHEAVEIPAYRECVIAQRYVVFEAR